MLVPFPENDENFLYFPYKSENPIRHFQALFYMDLSKISHVSRKIITESKYITRCLKYLPEVVNFGTAFDVTNTILGKMSPNS